ncbi:hypothetical protein FP026_27840 [Rhizobium tropici]|uniref:Uncharacterized protein n=1 Tax=Rhizobium tropici TaxID=398 RepID=A0A5B0VS79_RHITR|nr:hypothetical protein [Rhizobium tropici]KAA1176649.1 hypothetical protein FP026_27840 [Rhizobium tropici]
MLETSSSREILKFKGRECQSSSIARRSSRTINNAVHSDKDKLIGKAQASLDEVLDAKRFR